MARADSGTTHLNTEWGRVIKPSGEHYSFLKSAELTNRIVWSDLVAIPKFDSQIPKVPRGRVGVRKRARIAGERVGGWEGSWLWFCWILIRWSNNRLETQDGKFQSCDCNWTSMLDWAQQGKKRHYSVKNIKDYFQRGKTVVSRDWGYFGLIFFFLSFWLIFSVEDCFGGLYSGYTGERPHYHWQSISDTDILKLLPQQQWFQCGAAKNVRQSRQSAPRPSPVTLSECRFSPKPRFIPAWLYYPVHGEEAGSVGGKCQLHYWHPGAEGSHRIMTS